MHFYPQHRHSWHLEECVNVPSELSVGQVKCRIIYDAHHFEIHYQPFPGGARQ